MHTTSSHKISKIFNALRSNRVIVYIALLGGLSCICSCDFSEAKRRLAEKYDKQNTKSTKTFHITDAEHARMLEGTPEEILDYEGFRLSFNSDNKTPNWVAWELLGTETEGEVSRQNTFWKDESVQNCPITADYSHSGYDRGHMCPAADQKWSEKAMNDCFVMTNICPQDHKLNSGAWNTLEKKERLWAKRDSALIIIAGPIYTPSDKNRIGKAKVRVPSAFFKVIIAPYLDNPRGIGFIYPNMSSPGNMRNYSMSIDEVERITGIDFFCNLSDSLQNILESTASFTEWDKRF